MSIPEKDQKLLFMHSGKRCAFPDCRRLLVAEASPADRPVILGEMAHIVAESLSGPRGNHPLPIPERNRYENLILLCHSHHQLIDDQPQTYSVEWLHAVKDAHEDWVERTLGFHDVTWATAPSRVADTVYSSLLPIEHMPPFVYGMPCDDTNDRSVQQRLGALRDGEMAPFILRAQHLWAFQDLSEVGNPFHPLVGQKQIVRCRTKDWWDDPDRGRWFVDLLNRTLNKLTGRRGLQFDREHRRYYFQPRQLGQERSEAYRPPNKKKAHRKVVWQPRRRATGEPRDFWIHRARNLSIGLRHRAREITEAPPQSRSGSRSLAEVD